MARKIYKKKPFASKKRTTTNKSLIPSKVIRPINALSTVAVQHQKLLLTLFDKIHFQYRQINEDHIDSGKESLGFGTASAAAKPLPCHVYDLTQLNTESSKGTPQYKLYLDASDRPWFSNDVSQTLETVGVEDGSEWNNTVSQNKGLLDHINLRVELFGRGPMYTRYRLMLVQFTDEELTPKDATTGSSANARFNAYWKTLVRPFYTNAIVPQDPLTKADLSNRVKVLWQKDYKLTEKENSFDQNQRKLVKIFKKINQIKTYNEEPRDPTGMNGNDDPDTMEYPIVTSYTGNATTQCRVPQRLYLVILANSSVDQFASGLDAEVANKTDYLASYNIWYDTKFTFPQSRS